MAQINSMVINHQKNCQESEETSTMLILKPEDRLTVMEMRARVIKTISTRREMLVETIET